MKGQLSLSPKTFLLLNHYLLLPYRVTKIACPYWVNDLDKGIKGPFSGKGTPGQIVFSSYRRARKLGIELDKLNKQQLVKFLKNNRIGVDCSGFVFHLLNSFDKENGGVGIANKYLSNGRVVSWRVAWRVNADTLSSEYFTREIQTEKVRPGDIIRLYKGKHVMFVTTVGRNFIVYSHCSDFTLDRGCHLGKIWIKDWKKGLEYQQWEELAGDNQNYKELAYFPKAGDSIRRPRWWSNFDLMC